MNNTTMLYFVRHAQTDWNVEGRFQGNLNSDLTKFGRSSAERLSEHVESFGIEKIITSDSPRAQQTAGIINQTIEVPLEITALLREINLGPWEGELITEVKKKFKKDYEIFRNFPDKYEPENAESYFAVVRRLRNFLESIESGENVLIVTHGMIIKVLRCLFLGLDLRNINEVSVVRGCSLTSVEMSNVEKGSFKLLSYGSDEYLL